MNSHRVHLISALPPLCLQDFDQIWQQLGLPCVQVYAAYQRPLALRYFQSLAQSELSWVRGGISPARDPTWNAELLHNSLDFGRCVIDALCGMFSLERLRLKTPS